MAVENMSYKNIVEVLILLSFLLCANCVRNEGFAVNLVNTRGNQEIDDLKTNTPDGSEIEIKVEKITSNKYKVRIFNISSKEVYCPYLPGRYGSNKAEYFPFIEEKKNLYDSNFSVVDTGGTFAPGIYPIQPKQFVEFDFFSHTEGEYRLRFSYIIDESIANLINSKEARNLTKDDREKIEASFLEIVSPSMVINKTFRQAF